jgi:hypothetical protein
MIYGDGWTVDRLIERLQEISEEGHGDSEIRLATQPNYPLRYTLAGVAAPADLQLEGNEDGDEDSRPDQDGNTPASYVWLAEGSHDDRPYDVPREVWEAAR